jgi:hypothetical protein
MNMPPRIRGSKPRTIPTLASPDGVPTDFHPLSAENGDAIFLIRSTFLVDIAIVSLTDSVKH